MAVKVFVIFVLCALYIGALESFKVDFTQKIESGSDSALFNCSVQLNYNFGERYYFMTIAKDGQTFYSIDTSIDNGELLDIQWILES